MLKRNGGIAAFVFIVITAMHGTAFAGWFNNAMGPVDLVAGGKQWNAFSIESEDGLDKVTFLPAGQTAEEASEMLTFTVAIEDVPSSAYDALAAIDRSHNDGNTKNYKSSVAPQDQTVRARGLYVKVPGRTYSQLFSLQGSYLGDGKTFLGATYRVNVIADSNLAKKPDGSLDILDQRVQSISQKQIKDWFKYFHEKAKQRLAAEKNENAPKS